MIAYAPSSDDDYGRDDSHSLAIKLFEDLKFQLTFSHSYNNRKSGHDLAVTCDHGHRQAMKPSDV